MKIKNKILSLLGISLISTSVYSYPQFVGYGYTSCVTCHYNPFGNGPLNDYGRALSATAVSSRWLIPKYVGEEELANKSGFLGSKPQNTWFRPSFDYRGLLIKRGLGQEGEDTEWINMMADANVVVRFDKANKFFISGTLGYAPKPAALEDTGEEVDTYRWREHYLGYRPSQRWGFYLGLMDKVYGIRIAEHTNFSRSITNLSQNDQSHGLQIHYAHPKFELGLNYFVGNMVQEDDLRQKGFSLKADYVVSHKSTTGVSVLKSENSYLEMYMTAFHYKTAVGKGSSFLAEYGQVATTEIQTQEEEKTVYGLAQAYLNGTRGLFIINSVEYLKEDTGDYRLRFGPGIQFFPIQRLELRFELYNSRSFSESGSTKDTWDFLGQTHLWF